jgi:Protein of Unknown function (DUF2784)
VPDTLRYQLLADLVLTLHFAVVLFVVGGLVVIIVGNQCGRAWVNTLWFRLAHLAAIGFVVLQSWLGATCPLTHLENWLRTKAQAGSYAASFIEHWIQRILFYQAPAWVFAIAYTLFGLLVVAAWIKFPPRRRSHRHTHGRSVPY